MASERLEVGALLQRTWTVATTAPAAVTAFIAGMSLLGIFTDIYYYEAPGVLFLVNVANFVAGFFLMIAILRAVGLRRDGEGGNFGAYFGVSFLGGLGMVLGFLLLIVPGVILMARWSAAFSIALCEDETSSGALGESWRMTDGQTWPIFAALLIGLVPLLLAMVAVGVGLAFTDPAYVESAPSLIESVVLNAVASTYSVFSTSLGIAVYSMLRGDRHALSEVFA